MRNRLLLGLGCLLVAVVLWWVAKPRSPAPVAREKETPAVVPLSTPMPAAATPAPATAKAPPPSIAVAAQPPALPPVTDDDDTPAQPAPPPPLPANLAADLENVSLVFRDYRTVLGENPIGTNAEITRALLGHNLKQVKMDIPAGSSINANGEMVDRWGTPYFFHQVSGKVMEIRSAGPDKQMWTRDDREVK